LERRGFGLKSGRVLVGTSGPPRFLGSQKKGVSASLEILVWNFPQSSLGRLEDVCRGGRNVPTDLVKTGAYWLHIPI